MKLANANMNFYIGDDFMAECSTCPSNDGCSKDKESCMIENNPLNNVKKIIGVMSGKGGVGKSSISVLIAKHLKQLGYKVGILDADITGPSVPRLLGLKEKRAGGSDELILPVETIDGIKVMSLNFLTDKEDDPVIWRGPIISGVVKQFWTDVLWEDLDYLVIDMPPGTGDVALTVMQSIPINGIVMVSVPQDLVSMIVSKAVNMARKMNINVLGVIENMSYITCTDCGKKIKLFNGESTDKFLKEMDLRLLGELPMLSSISNLAQSGYESSDESLKLIFNPIVTNIIKDLEDN
jgi:Mrp family chromosome partitioning ATPase